jgi:hypothetical protein
MKLAITKNSQLFFFGRTRGCLKGAWHRSYDIDIQRVWSPKNYCQIMLANKKFTILCIPTQNFFYEYLEDITTFFSRIANSKNHKTNLVNS